MIRVYVPAVFRINMKQKELAAYDLDLSKSNCSNSPYSRPLFY
jgi:hypothetical protein